MSGDRNTAVTSGQSLEISAKPGSVSRSNKGPVRSSTRHKSPPGPICKSADNKERCAATTVPGSSSPCSLPRVPTPSCFSIAPPHSIGSGSGSGSGTGSGSGSGSGSSSGKSSVRRVVASGLLQLNTGEPRCLRALVCIGGVPSGSPKAGNSCASLSSGRPCCSRSSRYVSSVTSQPSARHRAFGHLVRSDSSADSLSFVPVGRNSASRSGGAQSTIVLI